MHEYVFPAWFAILVLLFLFFEARKQYRRFFEKGSANVLMCLEVVNNRFEGPKRRARNPRIMPRTEELPLYTLAEFNEKVAFW